MNLWTQMCGNALLITFGIFYFRQKLLHLATERIFQYIYFATVISLALDQLSIVALYHYGGVTNLLVIVLCKAYLCSLVFLSFCAMLYIKMDLYYYRESYFRKIKICYYIAMSIGLALIILLPIYSKIDVVTEVIYTYGPSVLSTYAFAGMFVAFGLHLTIVRRKRMNSDRRIGFLVWTSLWAVAALVQFIRNDWLIVGYACALGVVVLYLKLENPMFNLERETGFYNQESFRLLAQEQYMHKKDFCFLIILCPADTMRFFKTKEGNVSYWKSIYYLNQLKDVNAFRYTEDKIILYFNKTEDAENRARKIMNDLLNEWSSLDCLQIRMYWMLIKDCLVLKNVEDLYAFMHFLESRPTGINKNELCVIDRNNIQDMYREREMEKTIDWVIQNNEVYAYYQPIYSNKEKRFISAEALMRIKDQEGNMIPPFQFIPIAEQTGQIKQLGKMIFRKVCEMIIDENIKKLGISYIEVNLSVVQCMDARLADDFISIMEYYHVSPESINLEITESAAIADRNQLLENMRRLVEYGVSFSLDDFGTGQSNLNYIVDMPVSIVKFDKTMVDSYFASDKAKYVMNAAMNMIHGMALKIVAEGIETKEQLSEMAELGINYIQGYYFSKPVPQSEFLKLLMN